MLVLSGDQDTLSDITHTKTFFDSLQNVKQKRLIQVPDGDHYMPNWEHSYETV